MKKILYLLILQLLILLLGVFFQQKGFITLQEFYTYTIVLVACIAALVIRDIYIITKQKV